MGLEEFPNLRRLMESTYEEIGAFETIHRRYSLTEMYALTKEALTLVGNPSIQFDGRINRLNFIMQILDYQTNHDYKGVRSVFMPRLPSKQYKFGTEQVVEEPERWSEPFVRKLFRDYFATGSGKDNIRPVTTNLSSDAVYSNIVNPNVRKKIAERGLKGEEYNRILAVVEQLQPQMPQLPSGVVAIQPYRPGALVKSSEQRIAERLDISPPALLAIESELSEHVVSNFLQIGLKGSEIVDAADLIRDHGTNPQVIRELKRNGIDPGYWDSLISTSRRFDISVANGIRKVKGLGGDVEEFLLYANELEFTIGGLAERAHWPISQAFDYVFQAYLKKGRNLERTADFISGEQSIEVEEEE